MTHSIKTNTLTTLECPLKKHWISVRLVDEYGRGSTFSGLHYLVKDSQGQEYRGTLDSEGLCRINTIYCGPAVLDLSQPADGFANPWYHWLLTRENFPIPVTPLQFSAEESHSGPRNALGQTYLAEQRAIKENARFYRVEVSDFVEAKAHLPDTDSEWGPRPSATLKQNAGAAAGQPGIALAPNQHYVLEVKALRAYSPLLSRDKAFCAINAYHLAVMSSFAYAPFSKITESDAYKSAPPPYGVPGSIGNVLREQLAYLFKSTAFDRAHYNLLYEEVPYSKRLEIMPYDETRYSAEVQSGWRYPEDVHFLYDEDTGTQAFITHNDKVILISVRGTEPDKLQDLLRDADANQVPYAEGAGQAHRGFYGAFQAVKEKAERYLDAFYTGGQTLIVCGHSLGGAIALLLSEWLRRNWSEDIQLYTFGAPRAADHAFVQGAQALTHHRLVNHDDPVPGVPFSWTDTKWSVVAAGTVVSISSLGAGIPLILGGLLNLKDDPYEHHGQQRHFISRKPNGGSESAVLWQPGCALIDEQACARYAGAIDLERDMPARNNFIRQLFSFSQHARDAGYARSMLTTLLRWNAGVQDRGGELFTAQETRDLHNLIKTAQEELANWRPRTFGQFVQAARASDAPRFRHKTDMELRRMYNQGITLAKDLSYQQQQELERAQKRLLNEAARPLTLKDVYGDLSDMPQLQELIAEWRALADNQKAEKLANIPEAAQSSYA